MKKTLFYGICIVFSHSISAQNCPPSTTKGIHTVQKGETLYGIAKKYKISIDALTQLNEVNINSVLKPCTDLKVAKTNSAPSAAKNIPTAYNTFVANAAKSKDISYMASDRKIHVIQAGERLDEIAVMYGYTAARLKAMNDIQEGEKLYIGQELKVTDCACPPESQANTEGGVKPEDIPVAYNTVVAPSEETPNEPTELPMEITNEGVPSDEFDLTAEKPRSEVAATDILDVTQDNEFAEASENVNYNTEYFTTSQFVPFYYIVATNNETPESVGRLYGLSGSDVMMMNNLKSNMPLRLEQKLMLEDRTKTKQSKYINDNVQNQSLPKNYNTVAQAKNEQNIAPSSNVSDAPLSTSTSMSAEEVDMVREVNMVRANPKAYIKYIEEYIDVLRKEGDQGTSIQTAYELINELNQTPRLSTLQPLQCIYIAAKKHGDDQRIMGDTNHQGSDGSWPWDRVLRECKELKDGNENLVGGPSSIRRCVVLLLVDDGIEGRGHRKTMLNPDWKYIACHKMGTIGSMPNCWVQKFGY
jgi:LysM repeat protein